MDIKKPINLGSTTVENLPNDNTAVKQYGVRLNKNISTDLNPSDVNFKYFTLICFGINGGYNGFRHRVQNWNQIREYFK
jgi:hypothetical protein